MELKEFIKQTIIEITEGMTEGHKYLENNLPGSTVADGKYTEIKFDVAVVSDETEKTGAGAKINVFSIFKGGLDVELSQKNTNQSRIQFSIHMFVLTGESKRG